MVLIFSFDIQEGSLIFPKGQPYGQLLIAVFFHSCKVLMDVEIKIVHSRSSDQIRAFPCFMTIRGNHNHPIDMAEVLNELRVSPCTREMFNSYFSQGIYSICNFNLHSCTIKL